jgi:hypothetical protein
MWMPIGVASIVFVCILLGSGAGIVLSTSLSEHHFSDQTKDVVRLAAGIVGTMTALVLGLVLASERSAFEAEDAAVKQGAINIVVLDRMLSQYGPETNDLRKRIRQAVANRYSLVWLQTCSRGSLPSLHLLHAKGSKNRIEALGDNFLVRPGAEGCHPAGRGNVTAIKDDGGGVNDLGGSAENINREKLSLQVLYPPPASKRDSDKRTMGGGSTVPTSTDSISRDLDISKEKLSLQVLYTPAPARIVPSAQGGVNTDDRHGAQVEISDEFDVVPRCPSS